MEILLQKRPGGRPVTTKTNPHQQLTQTIAPEYHSRILDFARSLAHAVSVQSLVSVPGAVGFILEPEFAHGPPESFMSGTEFAHLHPLYDGSMHMMLPDHAAESVIAHEWGEAHPMALNGYIPHNAVMIYAPRNETEFQTIISLLNMSYAFAAGEL